MPKLETEDFRGVPVLEVGGPYFGQGSPPEGDYYTEADLRAIAENTRRLMEGGELRAPLKLGHSIDQKLAKESGYSDGEMPALGWLDNPRVEGDKLVTDLRRVPKKLADLLRAGAFRTRSVELRSYVSQRGGERIGPAIKGLALQGAKAPAVRTLDDVIALYSDEAEEDVQIREYGEIVWNPDLGYRWVQDAITRALSPEGAERYYVADVGPESALVEGKDAAWVVPFAIEDDTLTVAPADEWTRAQPRWTSTANAYAESSERLSGRPADTNGKMGLTLTDEQARDLAERLGLDTDALDFEGLTAKADELRQLHEDDGGEGEGGDEGDTVSVPRDEWEQVKAAAASGAAAEKKLAESERDRFLDDAVKDGKILPADKDEWQRRYDEHPEIIREVVTALRPHVEFEREFGSDDSGRGIADDNERALGDAFDGYMGIPEDQRVIGGKG